MEWKWNYGQGVLVLPSTVPEADATPEQLRVLLWLASDPTLFAKPAQLARLAGMGRRRSAGGSIPPPADGGRLSGGLLSVPSR